MSVSSAVLSWQPLLAPLIAPPPPACWITTTGESYLASSMPSVKWEKWVGRPHGHPPPKTGSGGLVWTSKLTRHPLPNPDLPAPQLPTPQHQTKMELQDAVAPDDAGAQHLPSGPKNELGLTRLLWRPEDKAPLRCPQPVRLWLPEFRQALHHHHHHPLTPQDSLRF